MRGCLRAGLGWCSVASGLVDIAGWCRLLRAFVPTGAA